MDSFKWIEKIVFKCKRLTVGSPGTPGCSDLQWQCLLGRAPRPAVFSVFSCFLYIRKCSELRVLYLLIRPSEPVFTEKETKVHSNLPMVPQFVWQSWSFSWPSGQNLTYSHRPVLNILRGRTKPSMSRETWGAETQDRPCGRAPQGVALPLCCLPAPLSEL